MAKLLQTVTTDLRVSRSIVKGWLITTGVVFIITAALSIVTKSDITNSAISAPNAAALLFSFKYLLRIVVTYLVLSLIPLPWLTQVFCFVSSVIMLSGFAADLVAFSFSNVGGFVIWTILRFDYVLLIYTVAVISIQTINNLKYQPAASYVAKWFQALKSALASRWVILLITMAIYVVVRLFTYVPLPTY